MIETLLTAARQIGVIRSFEVAVSPRTAAAPRALIVADNADCPEYLACVRIVSALLAVHGKLACSIWTTLTGRFLGRDPSLLKVLLFSFPSSVGARPNSVQRDDRVPRQIQLGCRKVFPQMRDGRGTRDKKNVVPAA